MTRHHDDPPYRARIPADVYQPDKIMFGLTGRQVVILTVAALVGYGLWWPVTALLSQLVFVAAVVPYSALAFFLAIGRRDGLGLDAWLWAALRHRRAPHRMVPTESPVAAAPAWIATTRKPPELPGALRLPVRAVRGDGVIDLGPDGSTVLVAASTVAFSLRTAGEQAGLVAGFGRWLNSLDTPVQIVVRARPVDLTMLADTVLDQAAGLPHPALEDAARSHAGFLDELAAGRELLYREVTVAVRDRRGPAQAIARGVDAARGLAGCEVTARVLDPADTTAVLAGCLDPYRPPLPGGLAPTTAVIHGLHIGETP
jgi:hypothetical protein